MKRLALVLVLSFDFVIVLGQPLLWESLVVDICILTYILKGF